MDDKTAQIMQQIPAGAVINVWGQSLFGKLIKWYEGWVTGDKDCPNHSAIYVGAGKNLLIEAETTVQANAITRYFDSRHKVTAFIYKPMTVEEQTDIKNCAYSSIGKIYAVVGIVAYVFKKIRNPEGQNYCSQLVAEVFFRAGVQVSNIPVINFPDGNISCKVSPADIQIYCQKSTDWQEVKIWGW